MRSSSPCMIGASLLSAFLLGAGGTSVRNVIPDDTFSVLQTHQAEGVDRKFANSTNDTNGTNETESLIKGPQKTVTHHHYGLIDKKLSAAIFELQGIIAEFKLAKQKMVSDSSIISVINNAAKLKVKKWWKETKDAAAMERYQAKELLNTEGASKEDAIMTTFRMKDPDTVLARINKDFELDDPISTVLSSKKKKSYWVFAEKLKYYWNQMNKGNLKDRVLIKTWIYTQQGLYLSAFHSVFMQFSTGTKSQINHGLPIEQLEEILTAVGDLVAVGMDEESTFVPITAEIVGGVRKLSNNKQLHLRQWVDGVVNLTVPEGKRAKVSAMLTKGLRPMEKKFVEETSVRPEVLELKRKMDLGPAQRKEFDAEIKQPLDELLQGLKEKKLKEQERKLAMSLLALGNEQYVTALRILLQGEGTGMLNSETIAAAMSIFKGVAKIRINNKGVNREVDKVFDKINPTSMKIDQLLKIRKWASDYKNVPTTLFAEKLISFSVDDATMKLFSNMFLNKMSAELPSGRIPDEFMPKKKDTKAAANMNETKNETKTP